MQVISAQKLKNSETEDAALTRLENLGVLRKATQSILPSSTHSNALFKKTGSKIDLASILDDIRSKS